MIAIKKAVNTRKDETLSTDSLIEFLKKSAFLKNNIFEHETFTYKQLKRTSIGSKITPLYTIILLRRGNTKQQYFKIFRL